MIVLETINSSEQQLKSQVDRVLNYLKIGNSWQEFKPNNLKFAVDKSGNLVFKAKYNNKGFLLSWLNGELSLTNVKDNLTYNSEQISDLGNWLINFNVDGSERFLSDIQDVITDLGLKNISNLPNYTKTMIN